GAAEPQDEEGQHVAPVERAGEGRREAREQEEERGGDDGAHGGQRERADLAEGQLAEREVPRPDEDHHEQEEVGAPFGHRRWSRSPLVEMERPCRNGRPTGPSASVALTSSSSWPPSSSPPAHLPPGNGAIAGMLGAG